MSETVAPGIPVAATAQPQAPVTTTAPTTPTLATEQGTAPTEAPALVEGQSALTAGVQPAPEGETAPEAAPEAEAQAPEPIVYEDFKLPEGMAKDDPLLTKFADTASKSGLSQEAAQAVIDSLAPQITEAMQAPYKEWEIRQTAWLTEINKDPDIGGSKLPQVQARIGKLLNDRNFVTEDFAQAMIETGAGNHPAVVRTFARLAARLTEAEPVRAGAPAAQPKSLAERLYPNLPPR
jgi:hypothetical protein